MTRIAITASAALLAVAALAPVSQAAGGKNRWATVNFCDTARHPNEMGVRARMPGDGTRGKMFMRFTAQYRTSSGWRKVSGKGSSGWLSAGSSMFRYQERGYTFKFDTPPAGTSYLMRGVVNLQWRDRNGNVEHRRRLVTEGGHPSRGADPKGFSAARCRID